MKTNNKQDAAKIRAELAETILRNCGIPFDSDYETLSREQVMWLMEWAHAIHYYPNPKNANGSRGRYFHAKLERDRVAGVRK